jgi:PPOX class probable F420-dependent enzyme
VSRRAAIRMTDHEVEAFLAEPHHLQVATIGRDGRPHLVAMWYGFFEGAPAFWTYGKSQKIVNLRRDPRLTCLVEAGTRYKDLQGVELIGTATILEGKDEVMAVGRSVYERYTGPYTDDKAPVLEATGAKRVAVRVDVEDVVSWDHRKLGGTY